MDVVLGKKLSALMERLVVPTQRGPRVAGDEARGPQASRGITLPLDHRKADQCLCAGDVDPARGLPIPVFELI